MSLRDFVERLTVTILSGIFASVTLLVCPFVLLMLGIYTGGTLELELPLGIYSFIFSKLGLFIIISAMLAGFCFGSGRLANIFSFFLGTHSFWGKLNTKLNLNAMDAEEKFSDFQEKSKFSLWVLLALLFISVLLFLI